MGCRGKRPRKVIRAREWRELPEILEPGVYYVRGVKFTVCEPLPREAMRQTIRGIMMLEKKYGKSSHI